MRGVGRLTPTSVGVRAIVGFLGVVFAVTTMASSAVLMGAMPGGTPQAEAGASTLARNEVPEQWLSLYREAAATCPGLPWTVLAAVGRVESHHGRNAGVSSAGALGPMQFMPATWGQYGMDADGNGVADIQSPTDAIFSAARMLCANGGGQPGGIRGALWAYNHASWYVDLVLATAEGYASQALFQPTIQATTLLTSRNLVLTDLARGDIEAGRVDARVMDLLARLTVDHTIAVSVIQSGHAPFVEGTTRYSFHTFGRAVDIYMVDGEGVSPMSASARLLVLWLQALEGPSKPSEIGHPFPDLVQPGSFTDSSHLDHIHIGYSPPPAGGSFVTAPGS